MSGLFLLLDKLILHQLFYKVLTLWFSRWVFPGFLTLFGTVWRNIRITSNSSSMGFKPITSSNFFNVFLNRQLILQKNKCMAEQNVYIYIFWPHLPHKLFANFYKYIHKIVTHLQKVFLLPLPLFVSSYQCRCVWSQQVRSTGWRLCQTISVSKISQMLTRR